MDGKSVFLKDIPESFLKIGGVQSVTYFYLLAQCCNPDEHKNEEDRTVDFSGYNVINDYISRLRELVKRSFIADPDIQGTVDDAMRLREEIKLSVTDLMAYQDGMTLREYVLNRLKPADAPNMPPMNDDAEARDILSRIFRSGSNASINENIIGAVTQLPLKMTRARFHDIILNELKIYAGESRKSFERNMFLMTMSAGLSEWPKTQIPGFMDCMDRIDSIDPKTCNMSLKAAVEDQFSKCVQLMEDYRGALELTIRTVNHLIVYLKNYRNSGAKDFIMRLKVIADEAESFFERGCKNELSDKVQELFESTVGVIEAESELLVTHSRKALKFIEENNEEYKDVVEHYLLCNMLISDSQYADLDAQEEETDEKIDIAGIEKEVDEFFARFSKAAANDKKSMVKARMAAVFTNIPVFFKSRNEVMKYVCEAISGCSDPFEKAVSVELAKKAMV